MQDLVGIVRPEHLPSAPPPSTSTLTPSKAAKPAAAAAPPPLGARLQCRVLDVSQAEGIVDLTARPDLLTAPPAAAVAAAAAAAGGTTPSKAGSSKKGKGKAGGGAGGGAGAEQQGARPPAPGDVVEGVVELVRGAPAHYAVLSLPGRCSSRSSSNGGSGGGGAGPASGLPPLVCASLTDFSAATPEGARAGAELRVGARVRVTVASPPGAATGGRWLGVLPLFVPGAAERMGQGGMVVGGAGSGKGGVVGVEGADAGAEGGRQSVRPGSVVVVRVSGVGSGQADVVVGRKLAGRVHISQVRDAVVPPQASHGSGGEGGAGAAATPAANGSSSSSSSSKKRKQAGGGGGAAGSGSSSSSVEGLLAGAAGEAHLWHGNPLDSLSEGQQVEAVVLGRGSGTHHHGVLELSTRPALLEAAKKVGESVSRL